MFEEARPADYLMRAAASDLGKAYKGIAAGEMAIRPGDVVLDLGCGPGPRIIRMVTVLVTP